MRRIVIGLILALVASPAAAQNQLDIRPCGLGAAVAPDILIKTCTDYIASGGRTNDQLAAAYNNRGLGYRADKKLDPAIADFTEAISLKADDRDAYFNRGLSYGAKGETDQAIADFSKVIAITPDFSAAFTLRGYSREQEKQRDLAIADYRTALKLNPKDNVALQGLDRLGVH